MAKFHLDRLQKKYKNIPVKGETYQELINKIIAHQSERITRKVAKVDESDWKKSLKKIKPKEKVLVPSVESVLPKQSIFARKAAERGELIKDTLRDKLTGDLRQSVDAWNKRKEGPLITRIFRKGRSIDAINPKLIKNFEKNIKGTFDGYTKKDPVLGMPTNIHTIAVTEVRSTINEIKGEYAARVLKENPDVEVTKEWRHNKSLSKEPRPGHVKINGTKVGQNEKFHVERYTKKKGKWVMTGITLMKYPHDPDAPPDQVISCNCDYILRIRKKSRIKIKKSLTENNNVLKSSSMEEISKTIKIPVHPYGSDKDNYKPELFAVEKTDETGNKRRYLRGVATGPKKDFYGERLTENCVNSIIKQFENNDTLLYSDVHGIRETEDISILTDYKLLDDGDLFIETRLYDELDEVSEEKIKINNTLWNQIHGLPPYTKKRQKGFSIEGYSTIGDLASYKTDAAGNMIERVINDMNLVGIIICGRPAYTSSIISGVYKSLGMLAPGQQTKIKKTIHDKLSKKIELGKIENNLYEKKWRLRDALDDEIQKIMKSKSDSRNEELEILLTEHKNIYKQILIASEPFFLRKEKGADAGRETNFRTVSIVKDINSLLGKVINNNPS
jgi:dsDNA-binding SOS-regulon protein